MNQATWTKVKAAKAAEVCRHFDLKEEARPLLRDGQSPCELVESLLAHQQYAAAIDFLAHALPPREAVWWGCLCLRHAAAQKLPPAEEAACKAAVEWVMEPTDGNRKAAQVSGEKAGLGTPAGGLALAATWTGGSLAPPNAPAVPPGRFMPAKAVAGAVLLTAVKGDPVKITDTQRLFVELGMGVAEGRFVWPDVKKKAGAKVSG
jgi:hypothetical protein